MLKLRKVKIKSRLTISLILTSLIPLIILGGYSSIKSSEAVTTKIETYSLEVMDQLSKNITNFLSGYARLSDELMLYEPLQNGLKNADKLSVPERSQLTTQVNEFINENYLLLSNINSIEIFTIDRKNLYSFGFHQHLDWDQIIDEAEAWKGFNRWRYIYFKGSHNIAIARRINNDNMNREGIGYLAIILKEEAIRELYQNINIGEGTTIFIMDEDGLVVSSDNKSDINVNQELTSLIGDTRQIGKKGILKKNEQMFAVSYFNEYDWYLMGSIPYSYINQEVNEIIIRIIALSICAIIAGIIISYIITHSITSPLNKLVKLIKVVKSGKFNMVNNTIKYNDEIGYLEKNFHEMRIQISRLIDTVKLEQEEKRKAEIHALQAQINPHFLFNTLNTIKWIAVINQSKTIEDGLESLSSLLRNTIIDTNEIITLKEEIENISHYMTIQKIRYGETIHMINTISEDFWSCRVLKFIMQPLVENAIIHGMDENEQEGTIVLTCEENENDLYIHIEDDGTGFNTSLLEKKNKKSKLSGIGIHNVDERIKLNYGADYGITIKSIVGKGTKVTLKVPYMKDNNQSKKGKDI